MSILSWFTSLFNFGRRTQQVFRLFGKRRKNRNWIWISLLSIGTVFGLAASRNSNMMQRLFRGLQYRSRTILPANSNLADVEFADEIIPHKQKK